MDTNSQIQPRLSVGVPTESSDAVSLDSTLSNADVVRSENNILQWMSYLPEDCIKTMIEMGWDVST
jgi:hypothetical protein